MGVSLGGFTTTFLSVGCVLGFLLAIDLLYTAAIRGIISTQKESGLASAIQQWRPAFLHTYYAYCLGNAIVSPSLVITIR